MEFTGNNLENLSQKKFMCSGLENSFSIEKLNHRIDEIRKIALELNIPWYVADDMVERSTYNVSFGKMHTPKENINEAIDEANLISDVVAKDFVLKHISKELIQRGQFDKSLITAQMISESGTRDYLLERISEELVGKGKFNKAKEIARIISDIFVKLFVLRLISRAATDNKKPDEAEEVNKIIKEVIGAGI